MLTPVALAHLIMGDGSVQRHGLIICTNSFSIKDVVRLMNVLITRYRLECNLRIITRQNKKKNWIYDLYTTMFYASLTFYCYSLFSSFYALQTGFININLYPFYSTLCLMGCQNWQLATWFICWGFFTVPVRKSDKLFPYCYYKVPNPPTGWGVCPTFTGCFYIRISPNKNCSTGWVVEPSI